MKVRLLCNLGTNDFPHTPFKEGEEPEVADDLGAKLVRAKLAIDITPPETTVAATDNFQKVRAENINPPKTKPSSK